MARKAETPKMSPELQFLNYISMLKHLNRAGWVIKNVQKPETVAGHMYRMAIMSAFVINDPALDMNKCIRMSIAHDLGECIIGDITPMDGVDKIYKHKIESEAIDKLASLIPNSSADDIRQLFQEYANATTKEAKLVKDLDKFDMILQAYEYEIAEEKPGYLQEFFDSTSNKFIDSHPKVKELVSELYKARENNVPFNNA